MDSQTATNYCETRAMSFCTAKQLSEQPGCKFYEKAGYANRCMYFTFGRYCDCLKAQLNSHHGEKRAR
jgi:hypothetical protein